MSARCQVTGAGPGLGHRVSHSDRRTTRRSTVHVVRRHVDFRDDR